MKNFLDIDEQIEQNTKRLDLYYSNYQKTQGKISVLVIIYSFISIYILQVVKYPFSHFTEISSISIVLYIILLICFFIQIGWSIKYTYFLLKPIDVAYMNCPSFFYNNIRTQYENALNTNDESILNAYIKATYLNELEIAVKKNSDLFEKQSVYYDGAFKKSLLALVIYIICTGFVVFEPEKPKDFNLKNYPEILNTIDSLNFNYKIMPEEKKRQSTSNSSKVIVDPTKVIKTEPKLIRENFSCQKESETGKKTVVPKKKK